MSNKSTFALYFGNRGFFPGSLITEARNELSSVLLDIGHKTIMMDSNITRNGAIETPVEGKLFADFLKKHKGEFQGVILCLPNFGDETGAVEALKDANVPILIHAYPDKLDRMNVSCRRDAFCGKFSIMDVFNQYGVPFTALAPHVVHPKDIKFSENIKVFDSICRIVNGMNSMTVGAFGARTTAFKTIRFDELTLQKYGITIETFDLSEIIFRTERVNINSEPYNIKSLHLKNYSNWTGVPDESFSNIVKLAVVIDQIIEEYKLDALAVRCWTELQKILKISPCVILSDLNERGIPAACEVDICNAISMFALHLASGKSPACLDWNNNYGNDENKCILFHCGPVPQSLMTAKGQITDHLLLANTLGSGCSYGCNTGRIKATPFTFASSMTIDGKLKFFMGEGNFTDDKIPEEFFGCAGVAHIRDLQKILNQIGYAGYRHHVSVTPKHVKQAMREAFTQYLNYEISPIKVNY